MNKTLAQWLSHLETSHSNGLIDMGLERVGEVKKRMGLDPSCPLITVAGTNGKGSVCSFLTQIYTQAGFKTGTLTSPHLLKFNERIAVNSQPVSDEAIVAAFERIEAARGEISQCSVTRFVKGKAVEQLQCRISGYIPRPAPGRKPAAK